MKKVKFATLCFLVFCCLLIQMVYAAEMVTTEANPLKPHLARDFRIWIPENFDRFDQNSYLSITATGCKERLLQLTTKDIYPNQYLECTVGGLSPDTDYEFEVKINSAGFFIAEALVAFRTEPAPINETKRILMVIDEGLDDPELMGCFAQYAQDVGAIDHDIEI